MQATSSVVLGASRGARLESSPISRRSLQDAWILRRRRRQDVLFASVMHSISQSSPLSMFPVSCPALARNMTARSEEHTSELQSLMRISYAVYCLKKKNEI